VHLSFCFVGTVKHGRDQGLLLLGWDGARRSESGREFARHFFVDGDGDVAFAPFFILVWIS
jgi:hypothetical protein